MGSRALLTAGVAAALLVVVLGVDVAMTTSHALDVWTGSAWREIAREPLTERDRSYPGSAHVTIAANASDDVRFRLRVDNGYLWAQSGPFRVYHAGEEVASGDLSVPARGSAQTEFSIRADRLMSDGLREEPQRAGPERFVALHVEVDGEPAFGYSGASFTLREVSA